MSSGESAESTDNKGAPAPGAPGPLGGPLGPPKAALSFRAALIKGRLRAQGHLAQGHLCCLLRKREAEKQVVIVKAVVVVIVIRKLIVIL